MTKRKACIDMRGLSDEQKEELQEELENTSSEFRRKIIEQMEESEDV